MSRWTTVGEAVAYEKGYTEGRADAILRQWIPCDVALPKENGQYIIMVKYEHVDGYDDIYSEHGEWVDGHWDSGFGYYHCGRVEKVLAWMPLPQPWEGGI